MGTSRRKFFSLSLATGSVLFSIKTGLIRIREAQAEWPSAAFEASSTQDALASIFGDEPIIESDKIVIDVLDLAEDSAVVPIKVKANLESAEEITIVADKNPVPLVAIFKLGQSVVDGYVATRIKLAGPSHVLVVVKANGKLYGAQKFVTVTNGGCG